MTIRNKWFALSLAFLFTVLFNVGAAHVVAAADTTLKIGFVDINKIMKDSKAAKNARAAYQKDFESKKAIFKEKNDKVVNLENDLKNIKQDSPAWKDKREKLAQEVKELKRLKSDMDEQLKKKEVELTQKILTDIRQILQQFAKSENYSILFEKKAALVAVDGLDVTDKIIKIYDAKK
jgi:outer membrane protein